MSNSKISQDALFELLQPLYDDLWQDVKEFNKGDNLVQFRTRIGENFPSEKNTGIIFYGRATNGWYDEEKEQPDKRKTLFQHLYEYKSTFFSFIRKIAKSIYGEDCASQIAWSNVCKIAPSDGGNPSDALWEAQYKSMAKIIKTEIDYLSPSLVILITGNTAGPRWHDPMCSENAFPWGKEIDHIVWGKDRKTNKECTCTLYKSGDTYFALTDRPEFRSSIDHVNGIIDLIKKYKIIV